MIDPALANAPIATERLRLVPQVAAHAAAMMRVLADDRSHRFLPSDPPNDMRLLAARFARLETRRSLDGTEHWLNWVVFAEERPIGFVQATVGAEGATLAYLLHPSAWGYGYASEAVRAMIDHLQRVLAVTRCIAVIDSRNAASQKLAQRLGFSAIGTETQADFFKDTFSDEITFVAERPVLACAQATSALP